MEFIRKQHQKGEGLNDYFPATILCFNYVFVESVCFSAIAKMEMVGKKVY